MSVLFVMYLILMLIFWWILYISLFLSGCPWLVGWPIMPSNLVQTQTHIFLTQRCQTWHAFNFHGPTRSISEIELKLAVGHWDMVDRAPTDFNLCLDLHSSERGPSGAVTLYDTTYVQWRETVRSWDDNLGNGAPSGFSLDLSVHTLDGVQTHCGPLRYGRSRAKWLQFVLGFAFIRTRQWRLSLYVLLCSAKLFGLEMII